MDHSEVADATVDVRALGSDGSWLSFGSGFHHFDDNHIVTNFYVVKPIRDQGAKIQVRTEDDQRLNANLVNHSDLEENGGYDWAILELQSQFAQDRVELSSGDHDITRGDQVAFAGFPHGVGYGDLPDLLVQSANIAGFYGAHGFYLDGSVNKGNSGGPIVDLESETVIGYTTFKRYVEHETIDKVMTAWAHLHDQVKDADEIMKMGGLGYYDILTEMTRSFLLLRETIKTNANTGIGIGFKIERLDPPS